MEESLCLHFSMITANFKVSGNLQKIWFYSLAHQQGPMVFLYYRKYSPIFLISLYCI